MSTSFRLGAFILITLSILASGVFLIGNKHQLFSSTFRLNTEFPNVVGLNEGAGVRVGGIQVGTVRQIRLPHKSDENVKVAMELGKVTLDVLRKDSVAAIQSEGLLGDKYIELSFGSQDSETLVDGDTIESQPPVDFSALISKANDILDTTQDAIGKFSVTAGNLSSITTDIDKGKGSLGSLLKDKTIYNQATAGTAAFRDNMVALKSNFLLRGFFSKRGYSDPAELTAHEISRLPVASPLKTFSFGAGQLFDQDGAKLKNDKLLREAGTFLEKNKFGLVVVAASGGPKGDTEKIREITEAQALVVRNYFVETYKIDDTRLKTMGLGKTLQTGSSAKIQISVYGLGLEIPPPFAAPKDRK